MAIANRLIEASRNEMRTADKLWGGLYYVALTILRWVEQQIIVMERCCLTLVARRSICGQKTSQRAMDAINSYTGMSATIQITVTASSIDECF